MKGGEEILHIDNICKNFDLGRGKVLKACDCVDIIVHKAETVGIVGESGSGKSTVAKMLTRLYDISAGKIIFHGEDITRLKGEELRQHRKKIQMVFQDPSTAFNPKMRVRDIICEPLKNFGMIKNSEVDAKAREMLRLVELPEEFSDRYANNMSGGQRQRIAIARAIVNEPKVLLLDEPLGALDLKLRQNMQYELIRLKEELGITFVYVTHDQEEALTMSDTIVVMNQGYIQQIGTPENIYNEPENAFVADFIGHSNIIDGTMIKDELVEILGARWACVDKGFGNNKPVDVVIRPEDVELVDPSEGTLQGEVTSLIFKGVHYELDVMAGGYEWLVHTTRFVPVGTKVGIKVIPFNIQIMHKPESSDEKAVEIDA
mgnify:CR=1 FL=1